MLQQKRILLSSIADYGFILIRDLATQESEASEDTDSSLGDVVRDEREYVRQRLREELKREPTEQEVDEWLRQHTEGY